MKEPQSLPNKGYYDVVKIHTRIDKVNNNNIRHKSPLFKLVVQTKGHFFSEVDKCTSKPVK